MARDEDRLDTAHEIWDRWWRDAKQAGDWTEPEKAVMELVPRRLERGVRRVGDLGTGVGRHATPSRGERATKLGVANVGCVHGGF